MKLKKLLLYIMLLAGLVVIINLAISDDKKDFFESVDQVDTRIDNNGYWIKMAEKGLAELNPPVEVEKAVYTGSELKSRLVITEDSPDVPVTTENSTQSENSVFVNPLDNENVLNSNNSTTNPASARSLYGANDFYTFDSGETWEGELQGAGGSNSGDPATAIGRNGRWYVGYIASNSGQGVSYSDDEGETWTAVSISSGSGSLLDKNHLWIDNSEDSPYMGNLYSAWTPMSGGNPNNNEIELCYSDDDGESWSDPMSISDAVNAGSHNQGVNLGTGPNGEVYAVWAIYDQWPGDENAIGLAKSLDGGQTWEPAVRIIEDIRGIRNTETSKNMRENSFPSMDVDISDGSGRGNIYVTWANVGVPGTNQGPGIDVYMIKSEDGGTTWSDPIKVNQDLGGQGKEHYFPWITCDPETGYLSIVYYDDRNVSSTECEVYCSNSLDQGETWEDMKVSDVSYTPAPIPGLAFGYFGDYLGITARGGMVYPTWTDNRTGTAMTYCSPYQLIVVNQPYNFEAEVIQENGKVNLSWDFNINPGFKHFKIKRNGQLINTVTGTSYQDQLPDYGIYEYSMHALYDGGLSSDTLYTSAQWGSSHIALNPIAIYDTVMVGEVSIDSLIVSDTGQLPLDYRIFFEKVERQEREYCEASGGCGPYISEVQLGAILNTSDCDGYTDYSAQSTIMRIGESYELTVTNGSGSPFDVCGVWIDWNQNEDFTDDYPVKVSGSPGFGPYTAQITPPAYAQSGEARMRIRIIQTGELQPCGDSQYGEVEDYSVNVIDWINISPISGNIGPDSSVTTYITVDGELAEAGNTEYKLIFKSNDVDNPEYEIPYYLNVIPMMVESYAEPTEICSGESAQLFVDVEGGSGSYSFSWTSDPAGYASNEQNPVFENITQTTTFSVEVDDGINQVNSSASVTVNPLPQVDIGADAEICQGGEYTFDAGAGFDSYLWNTGATSQSITVNESGEYSVEVTNEFGCMNSDAAQLTVNPLPLVNLGPDTMICEDETLVLDAGNPGSTYLWSTGETTQTITIDTNSYDFGVHEFWVEVTNEHSCTASSGISVELKNCSFDIDEVFGGSNFTIYPNPNEGRFVVSFNSPARQEVRLRVIHASGNEVFKTENLEVYGGFKQELDLSDQPAGIYLVLIEKDDQMKMKKIIIR